MYSSALNPAWNDAINATIMRHHSIAGYPNVVFHFVAPLNGGSQFVLKFNPIFSPVSASRSKKHVDGDEDNHQESSGIPKHIVD